MKNKVKLAYLVSHPIQYQAPLLRRIAQEPDIDLTVFFGSDFSARSYQDKGFGVDVTWDVPLLDGYRYEFLPRLRDTGTTGIASPLNHGIFTRLQGRSHVAPATPPVPFDVVWVHGYATINALHGMVAAKALGIPVLLRAESWLQDRSRSKAKLAIKQVFFKMLKQLVAGVLPIGTLNAAYWRQYLGEDFPASLMPYAVDNAYFEQRSQTAQAQRQSLQAELHLDPDRPVILFASKLQTRKRCSDLLEAYLSLSSGPGEEPLPYLVIAGDGEERPALERRALESGCRSIRFCGFRNQSELPRFFDLSTVFVLPSEKEPWGLIVNEVMNAGRPVILSDEVGCQPDLITDGVEGYLFPAGDVQALTNALRKVLSTPQVAEQMGRRALDRIQTWSFEEDIRGLRQAIAWATRRITP